MVFQAKPRLGLQWMKPLKPAGEEMGLWGSTEHEAQALTFNPLQRHFSSGFPALETPSKTRNPFEA